MSILFNDKTPASFYDTAINKALDEYVDAVVNRLAYPDTNSSENRNAQNQEDFARKRVLHAIDNSAVDYMPPVPEE